MPSKKVATPPKKPAKRPRVALLVNKTKTLPAIYVQDRGKRGYATYSEKSPGTISVGVERTIPKRGGLDYGYHKKTLSTAAKKTGGLAKKVSKASALSKRVSRKKAK